jgi:hypothetical protein
MKFWRNLNDLEKTLIVVVVLVLLFVIGFPILVMTMQTEVGDTKTVNQQTPVYESYQPGLLGNVVCTLNSGEKVKIRQILTSNDLPGHEQTTFAEVKAYMVDTPNCSGWILPQYLK